MGAGVFIFEDLFQNEFYKNPTFSDCEFLSELVLNVDLACLGYNDYQKICCIIIIIKSMWIYNIIRFVTTYGECNIKHDNFDELMSIVNQDFNIILNNINEVLTNSANMEDVISIVRKYESAVIKLKELARTNVISRHESLLKYLNSLNEFTKVLSYFSCQSHDKFPGDDLEDFCDEKNDFNEKIKFFQSLKLGTDDPVAVQNDVIWIKSLFDITKFVSEYHNYKCLKKSNFSGVQYENIQLMKLSFSNYRHVIHLVKDTLIQLEIPNDKCTTTSFVHEIDDRPSDTSPLSSSLLSIGKSKMNDDSIVGGCSVTEEASVVTGRRAPWTKIDDILLYKGIYEKRSWDNIFETYFSKSGRTVISLKARWEKLRNDKSRWLLVTKSFRDRFGDSESMQMSTENLHGLKQKGIENRFAQIDLFSASKTLEQIKSENLLPPRKGIKRKFASLPSRFSSFSAFRKKHILERRTDPCLISNILQQQPQPQPLPQPEPQQQSKLSKKLSVRRTVKMKFIKPPSKSSLSAVYQRIRNRATAQLSYIVTNEDSDEASIVTGLRAPWTLIDHMLLYKGIKEQRQWENIHETYFSKSGRTLNSLKTRWEKISRDTELLNTLKQMCVERFGENWNIEALNNRLHLSSKRGIQKRFQKLTNNEVEIPSSSGDLMVAEHSVDGDCVSDDQNENSFLKHSLCSFITSPVDQYIRLFEQLRKKPIDDDTKCNTNIDH